MTREPIDKTLKMYVGGAFIRSESGRTDSIGDRLRVCRASRKDLRGAVEAAAKAQPGWASATAYLRGQIVYRIAEMLEGRRESFVSLLGGKGQEELDASIDLVVSAAGWADKHQQIFGTANPVAGPYHNFTVSEAIGVVGVIAPDSPSLLGMLALVAPAILSGNSVVVLASQDSPAAAAEFAEVLATSDVPAGVVNILTGNREELVPHFSSHREIGSLVASGVDPDTRRTLELGAAENLKRVHVVESPIDANQWQEHIGPGAVERSLEFKTIWHPSSA
jgi:acyl-CoA reductase-like NAD-dependent aldehyde dehydrogenase